MTKISLTPAVAPGDEGEESTSKEIQVKGELFIVLLGHGDYKTAKTQIFLGIESMISASLE
jgi:hypothetical protein